MELERTSAGGRRWRIGVTASPEVLDLVARHPVFAASAGKIIRPDRRFAVAAGDVEHISGLAQAGEPAMQRAHQGLALLDARSPMRGAGCEIAGGPGVRLDPAF